MNNWTEAPARPTPWEAKHYPEGSIVQPVGSSISILKVSNGTPCLTKADADLIVAAVNARQPARPVVNLEESYIELKGIIAALEAEDPDRVLPIGFHNPHSFRGYYHDIAFEPARNITIGRMLEAARSALGATYQGWKGGDFVMGPNSDCWIAEEGRDSDNKIGPLLLHLLLSQPAPTPADAVSTTGTVGSVVENAGDAQDGQS